MKDVDLYSDFTISMWASGKVGVEDLFGDDEQAAAEAEHSLAIMALGACGEGGEVTEHVKKLLRDGTLDPDALKKELGDAMYYLVRLSRFFGWFPSEVLEANVQKLESRRARGVVHGSGDNR